MTIHGIDPLFLDNVELNSNLLDIVTTKVPICLNHMSGHLMTINTRAVELSGVEEIDNLGIGRYSDGTCDGNIAEPENMIHVLNSGGLRIEGDPTEIAYQATYDAAKVAQINGCTTITDKAFGFPMVKNSVASYKKVVRDGGMSTRLVVEPFIKGLDSDLGGWDNLAILREELENDMFMFGNTKLLLDGSIQGYTANLLTENYYSGEPNGELILDLKEVKDIIRESENQGYAVSFHVNGNGATEQAIQAISEVRAKKPNDVFRHSLEHNQLVTENQLYRMKQNNIPCNFFINHNYFWGDIHAEYTIGPHEANASFPL